MRKNKYQLRGSIERAKLRKKREQKELEEKHAQLLEEGWTPPEPEKPKRKVKQTRGIELTFPEWIEKSKIVLNGAPYSLERHEYLADIIASTHPVQIFEKAAQVAITTTLALKSLWVADNLGKTVIYYFQDGKQVSDFVHGRVSELISESTSLRQKLKDVDNVSVKKLGHGTLYFRGLRSRGQVKSVPADMIIMDELDESVVSNRSFATDRLLHSDLAWVHMLSQPSLPNEGIDKEFLTSDQRYYLIKCPRCGYYNNLEENFPNNFLEIPAQSKHNFPENATHYRACSNSKGKGVCGTLLDMSQGEWVSKYPDIIDRQGWHLSQLWMQSKHPLFANWASYIMNEYQFALMSSIDAENFWISYLGYPYSAAGVKIDDTVLQACEGQMGFFNGGSGCYMGIDVGKTCHVVVIQKVGESLQLIHCEETADWTRFDSLMTQYGVSKCVIDAMPEGANAKNFAIGFPGRVVLQEFKERFAEKKDKYLGIYDYDIVQTNRTESLDATVQMLVDGKIILPDPKLITSPEDLKNYETFKSHCKELKSFIDRNAAGIPVKRYLSGRRVKNHYGMSINSARIAATQLQSVQFYPDIMPQYAGWNQAISR